MPGWSNRWSDDLPSHHQRGASQNSLRVRVAHSRRPPRARGTLQDPYYQVRGRGRSGGHFRKQRIPTSLTTSFSLPRAREARAATRPIPPELQPASSSRRSVSAVAPTAYLAELARRRHLTIAADLTGGRSIVPPRTGLGEKELATSVGSRSAAPTPGAGRSAAELSVSAVACPMRRLFAGRTERPTRGQRSPR